ncbi:MAG: glycosyltransferase [Gemmatimonadetes bacterium]|nr:glycosyltransferase [Gemmatimonadota bacterium]
MVLLVTGTPQRVWVLHVALDLHAGGLERLVADLIRRGDHGRFEYHLLVLRFLGRFGEGLHPYATLHVAPPMGRLSMLHPAALRRQIEAIAPDVIHTHSGVWYKVARAIHGLGRPPLVHTDHGRERPDPWQDRLVDWIASHRTAAVVAVSDVLAEQLRRTVVACPERVRTILNGVDTEAYAPRPDDGALRGELGLAPEVPIIGSIGRLEPIKGYDLMVEAFALLAREAGTRGPAPALVIAGEGGEQERLAARIAELGLGHRVFLLGWRSDPDRLYRAFTVFAMTSRSEGTSVSLLEAMSSGCCPVVTPVGGNGVVLGPALQHRMVAGLTPEDIAAGWRAALADPAARATDARAGRARVEQAFSLVAMTRAYEALYSGVRSVSSPSP